MNKTSRQTTLAFRPPKTGSSNRVYDSTRPRMRGPGKPCAPLPLRRPPPGPPGCLQAGFWLLCIAAAAAAAMLLVLAARQLAK